MPKQHAQNKHHPTEPVPLRPTLLLLPTRNRTDKDPKDEEGGCDESSSEPRTSLEQPPPKLEIINSNLVLLVSTPVESREPLTRVARKRTKRCNPHRDPKPVQTRRRPSRSTRARTPRSRSHRVVTRSLVHSERRIHYDRPRRGGSSGAQEGSGFD